MAKGDTAQAKIIVTTNAQAAKNDIEEINNLLKKLQKTKQMMMKESLHLTPDGKETATFKKLNRDIKDAQQSLKQMVDSQTLMNRTMNNLKDIRLKELKRRYRELTKELGNFSGREKEASKQWRDNLDKIKAQINQIEGNTKAASKSMGAFGSSLGTTLKNLVAYAGVFATFNRLKGLFDEMIQKNREMSDQLANIRKVSGLAMNDINGLATNLAKIDTRSSVKELNDLAYVGAKLGFGNLGSDALESFVKSALKVNNALKEDLGEDSMMAISKLVEVMGLIPKMGVEKAMDSAGSAIFKLSSTSTATGANIIEFSKRLMGLANVSHILVPELLGLASASDALGLMPEVSATAFNKVFTSIQSNTKAIEQSLQMQKGELTSLINEGKTMEAIVTVFDKMHGMNMDQLKAQGVFKALGSDGARLNNVMITMADRIDMLKTHLRTSNQAFSEGTAVAQEYAIQMETAEAYMQRAANMWEKAFVNPEGVDLTKEFAKAWYDLSKALTQTEGNAVAIKIIMESIFGIMKLLVELLPAIIAGFSTWGMWAGGAFLLKQLKELFAMLTAIGTGVRSISWAGLAGVITGVAMGTYILFQKFQELNGELQKTRPFMDGFKKDMSDLNTQFGSATQELDRYKRAIDKSVQGTKQRAAAIAEFNNKFGGYLKNMLTEKSTALDVANAYNEVTKALRAKMALQLKEKDISEQVMPREQWTAERREDYAKSVQGTQFSQYGRDWITTFAEENKGRNLGDVGKDLARIFGITAKEVANMLPSLSKDQSMNRALYTDKQWIVRNALRYIAQDRSARNAKIKVDEKWAPEQKAMDEYLASQTPKESPITPIDGSRLSKEEMQALKKEQAEAKKAMRKEMEDAQKESTAVINAIEEFYRLQEAAAEQMVADGKLTRSEADKMIEYLRNRKDEMLLEARRAITGNKNNFESLRQTMGKDVLRPGDEATDRAKETVQTVDVKKAADNLKKYDGGNNVFGLNSGSFTQSVLKNAAQNELNITRRQAKVQEEIDKILRQYQYVEEAQKSFGDDLVKLGIVTSGYEKVVQQLSDGTEVTANTRDVQALANKVTGIGTRLFNVDTSDAEELRNMVDAIMTTVDKDGNKMRESFASMFPKLDEWMAEPEKFKTEMQAFYKTLLDYDTDYYKAIKQSREQMRKDFDERWETSGAGQAYTDVGRAVDREGRRQKMTGADQGTNFAQQAGFATIGNDPEVQASLLRMAQMQQELDMFKEVNAQKMLEGEALLAYQQELREKQQAMEDAELAMQETLMSKINDHIQRLSQWTEPIQQFATDVGDAMGQAIVSGESMSEAMQNALKSLVQSWGQSTIQIVKELMMQQLKQKLIGKTMVKQEKQTQESLSQSDEEGGEKRLKATNIVETGMASVMNTMGQQILAQKQTQDQAEMSSEATKTTGTVMAGIAQGAAKIIGTLGPWGAPLIAVITALLMGLLSAALGALFGGGSGDKGGDTSTKKKVKLASGMLTYDEGNIQETVGQQWRGKHGEYITDTRQTVIGDDGRVYRARRQAQLPSGVKMITEPIATTVNGQQALVAERGPEIVIGRKTTRAIQMNRPDLLRDLMMFDRGMTTRKARTFDEGNLSDLASAIMPTTDQPTPTSGGDPSSERQALIERLDRSDQLMQQVIYYLQNPVAPNINMYGENGLHKKIKQADKFLKQYGG